MRSEMLDDGQGGKYFPHKCVDCAPSKDQPSLISRLINALWEHGGFTKCDIDSVYIALSVHEELLENTKHYVRYLEEYYSQQDSVIQELKALIAKAEGKNSRG